MRSEADTRASSAERYHHVLVFHIDVSRVPPAEVDAFMTVTTFNLTTMGTDTLDSLGFLTFFIPHRDGSSTRVEAIKL